ncbi:hypothetical protein OAY95_02395 [Candidatus Pelagibacter sp.]|nr:hypothetical protein [Candidatus Pelagibacter sp.]
MRYLRFTLLQSYILSIQKNKRKALLLINCGIFIAIFAVSSAIISFFIERDISEKQSEILQYQIQIKESSTMMADLEAMFNQYSLSIKNEEDIRVDKQFFSETKLGNKVFSANDFYIPYIQYSAIEISDLERAISTIEDDEYGVMSTADLFDINNKFNQDMIEAIKEKWPQEDIDDFTNSILKVSEAYKEVKKIDFENYKLKKFQTLEKISLEIKEYETFHLNSSNSKLIDDYFIIMNFDIAIIKWFSSFLYLMKSFGAAEEDFLIEINEEIIDLSKKEKNIILLTFLFQFFVFVIIQVFEINSINFTIRKKLL